jgi:signal transduction histidine kinase
MTRQRELKKESRSTDTGLGSPLMKALGPPAGRGSKIRLRILLPFTVLLVFVIAVFLVSTYLAEKRESEIELLEHAQAVQRLFQNELQEDASQMDGTLDAIIQDTTLQAAFVARDREAILRRVQPLFETLSRDHHISHFYFTGPDRINLLRVHQPDAYGDIIDRATTSQAERTGKAAYGIELGAFGTLTLRAVTPWKDGDRLIGYVELGHDVSYFVEEIREILDVDVLMIVYKKFVNRAGWDAGAATRRRPWQWDRFDTTVSVARTMQEIPAGLAPMLEQGQHPYQIVLPLEEDDRQAHVAFQPLHDAINRQIGNLVVIRDVTEERAAFRNSMILTAAVSIAAGGAVFVLFLLTLRRVEQDYRHKREVEAQFTKLSREHERIVQVEKLSAIGMMIGEIAHQINNPLVGVVNMAQLARRHADDAARTRQLLDEIVQAGKHCHAFVKRMVEFTKISRSEYRSTELRKLIEDTIILFRQSANPCPPVVPEFPDTPATLEVDPVMIRHAVFNLLSNAAQANTKAGDGTVTVRLSREIREKDRMPGWSISVEDRGPGLSEDIQKRMFTPFFTTRPEGTGLGLPVVQYVASLHDGSISASNNPDGGAHFRLWLPERRFEDEHET